MALWVSPCSTRQRKENSQQFSIPTHTHPAPCESLVPFALRQATIAVANCATLFFLARKILNYIRLQSARVSGKNHWKTAEQSNTWISLQSRCPDSDADIETDMNNNPPNFPFLPHLVPHPSPPLLHPTYAIPDKNNNCLSPAVHSFSTFSSGTFFARIVRTLSGCCRRWRRRRRMRRRSTRSRVKWINHPYSTTSPVYTLYWALSGQSSEGYCTSPTIYYIHIPICMTKLDMIKLLN